MDNIKTIKDMLFYAADKFGDNVFVKYEKNGEVKEKTYARLRDDAVTISSMITYMSASGPCQVSMIGTTSYEYIAVYFGVVLAQCSAVTLDAKLGVEDLCSLIRRSDSKIVFLAKDFESYANEILNRCPDVHCIINMHSDESDEDTRSLRMMMRNIQRFGGAAELINSELKREPKPEDRAMIMYTSGTTGLSKGVMLSHSNIVSSVFCSWDSMNENDVKLTALPINHITAMVGDLLNCMRYGITMCINGPMKNLEKNLKKYQPTCMILVPMIAESLANRVDARFKRYKDKKKAVESVFGPNFKMMQTGGAPINPETIERYKDFGIEICQCYGMTETAAKISTGVAGDGHKDSCGRVVRNCEVRVVDGELQVKGPNIMMGYYKDEENTAKAITEDGWLRTGDIGHVEWDNGFGYVYITGRLKNLIITDNGENVSPEELEEKIGAENVISEVVVYAKDNKLVAEIKQNSEETGTEDDEEAQKIIKGAIDRINEGLPPYKRIQVIKMRDTDFEKTTSGKIKRHTLNKD